MAKVLEDYISEVSYDYLNNVYVPSAEAIEFMNFIKMVNGKKQEEHKTPVIHLHMIDSMIHGDNNLFVVFRGSAKTTVIHEYMYLYLAVYGSFFGFGEVNVAMYISDTMENGVKNMRNQLEHRWNESEFLRTYVPKIKFTDDSWEFFNADGKKFFCKGFGATTGVRGFKKYGERPTWCHAKGTLVTTNEGTHKVEDYSNRSPEREEVGVRIWVEGVDHSEHVTQEHMYWGKYKDTIRWYHANELTPQHFIGSSTGINSRWKRVKNTEPEKGIFIPIHTPDHTYTTEFGLSHNCGFDDLMSDKNAKSPTILADIENVVYKGARQALHPSKRKINWTGTPFSKADSLYKAAGSKGWKTQAYPVCERYPCTKEEFRGAWEDRFTYEFIKNEYEVLSSLGKLQAFNQELMLRVTSEEDRLVLEGDIQWYSRNTLMHNKESYNFYITTDFATSEKQSADYSVISVWAINNKGYWFLVDGICARQTMDKNIDALFDMAQRYNPKSVGVEVTGQQGGFIQWIQKEMLVRNIWFNLASDGNSGKLGIRPSTNKLVRFQTIVPWFKAKRMFFPEEFRNEHPLMIEMEDELRYVSKEGFKSAHDDAADTISMLSSMNAWQPSQEIALKYNPDNNIWEDARYADDSSSDGGYGSYIV